MTALCDRFLSHVERRVFPGGCFFVSSSAELSARPGRVREQIVAAYRGWIDLLEQQARRAQELGEIGADEDVEQLVFELNGLLVAGDAFYLLFEDLGELERARRGVRARLGNSG